jgi:putative nucleotidyltransferase with HDIG domain
MPNWVESDAIADVDRISHQRRVAELYRRAAEYLGVSGPAREALVRAAAAHRDGTSRTSGSPPVSGPSRETADKMVDKMVETTVETMVDTLLQCKHCPRSGQPDAGLELPLHILEACDELDESIEFAAVECVPISVAITEFFEHAGSRFDGRIVEALLHTTTPMAVPILTNDLPVLPSAAAKLLRTSDENSTVIELERISASDPVLAARLLGAANSAYFGSRLEIRQLTQAIMRIGIPSARKVLLSACFGSLFASRALADLWNHSKTVAVHAHDLASECGYDHNIAYVAGLVHDIGRLVIQRCPAATRVEEESLRAAGFPLVYAEHLIYGADHAELGGRLLEKWNLPSDIVEAVACHHCPERTSSVLAALLNLAEDDALADGSDTTRASEDLWRRMRRAAAGKLTGIYGISRHHSKRTSAIWSLAS